MANYSKRDGRKAWMEEMASHRSERAGGSAVPACHCGAPAVLEVSMRSGTRYFCEAHKAEGEALFSNSRRCTAAHG